MTTIEFTEVELQALRKEYASAATDEQFNIWISECKHRGLWPVRDVVMQLRSVSEWNPDIKAKVFVKKPIYITTIGALRKLAERTGKYAGQLPVKWLYLDDDGNPTIESDVPLPEKGSTHNVREPWAAKVSILRKGFDAPLVAIARFWAYAQTYKDGGSTSLNSVWATRGPEQLAKCGESLALRQAFPEELSGLYISEEINDNQDEAVQQSTGVTLPVSIAVPEVNHVPAEGTNAPRPGEKPTIAEFVESITPTDTEVAHNLEEQSRFAGEPAPSPAEPVKTEPANSDIMPTKDEKTKFSNKLRYYMNETLPKLGFTDGKEQLQKLVLKVTGTDKTTKLTKSQWENILGQLDKAKESNSLKALLGE